MTAGLTYIGDLVVAGTVHADNTKKANLAATAPPGMSRDNGEGYDVGSVWVDIATDKAYICVDATSGSAVWVEVASAGHTHDLNGEFHIPLLVSAKGVDFDETGITGVLTVTGDTTLTASQKVVLCNAASRAIIITLPDASDSVGEPFFIKKIDSSANPVIVKGNGGELVDGGLTAPLTDEDEAITVVSDGSTWHIL